MKEQKRLKTVKTGSFNPNCGKYFKLPVDWTFPTNTNTKHVRNMCPSSYLHMQVNKHALQTIGYFREGDPSPQLYRKRVQHGRETPAFVQGRKKPHQCSDNILPTQFNGQREEGKMDSKPFTMACFQLHSLMWTKCWQVHGCECVRHMSRVWNLTFNGRAVLKKHDPGVGPEREMTVFQLIFNGMKKKPEQLLINDTTWTQKA